MCCMAYHVQWNLTGHSKYHNYYGLYVYNNYTYISCVVIIVLCCVSISQRKMICDSRVRCLIPSIPTLGHTRCVVIVVLLLLLCGEVFTVVVILFCVLL